MLICWYALEDFDFQAMAFGLTRTRPTTPSASRIVNSWLAGTAKDLAPFETAFALGLATVFAFAFALVAVLALATVFGFAAALAVVFALAAVFGLAVAFAAVFALATVFGLAAALAAGFALAAAFGFAVVFAVVFALATVFGFAAGFALATVFGLAATFAAVFAFGFAAALAGFFAVLAAIVWAPLSIKFRQLDCFQFVDTSLLRRNVAKLLQGWCLFVTFREEFLILSIRLSGKAPNQCRPKSKQIEKQ